MIQAGISQIEYTEKIEIPERWASDFDLSLKMFKEAGIQAKSA
jgi:deoxycytidylate deaminase